MLSKTRMVRLSAAEALGEAATRALPDLLEALKDSDEDVRYYTAQALGKIGPKAKEAVPALIEALKDSDEDVRNYAKEALAKIQKR